MEGALLVKLTGALVVDAPPEPKIFDVVEAAATLPKADVVAAGAVVVVDPVATGCDPNNAGCIPLFPPDLDCGDIKALGLAPATVIGKDPHKLDGDGDGKACTS